MGDFGRKMQDSVGSVFRQLGDLATGKKTIHDVAEEVFDAERGGDNTVTVCPTPHCVQGVAGHPGKCSPVRQVVKEDAP